MVRKLQAQGFMAAIQREISEAEALLERYARTLETPLSSAVIRAFRENPRHLFALEARPELSDMDMSYFYEDEPLMLAEGATISQPTFVLSILENLKVAPGQKVLEIGAGSGWNAGMLASLVGETGHVFTIEILPDLAQSAREVLKKLGRKNCTVITGDGGFGYAPGAPYDRVIFTAGAAEIPSAIFEQTADLARLAWVWSRESRGGGWDLLVYFRKEGIGFRSEGIVPCAFVPLTGAFADREHRTQKLPFDSRLSIRAFPSGHAPPPASGEKVIAGAYSTLLIKPL